MTRAVPLASASPLALALIVAFAVPWIDTCVADEITQAQRERLEEILSEIPAPQIEQGHEEQLCSVVAGGKPLAGVMITADLQLDREELTIASAEYENVELLRELQRLRLRAMTQRVAVTDSTGCATLTGLIANREYSFAAQKHGFHLHRRHASSKDAIVFDAYKLERRLLEVRDVKGRVPSFARVLASLPDSPGELFAIGSRSLAMTWTPGKPVLEIPTSTPDLEVTGPDNTSTTISLTPKGGASLVAVLPQRSGLALQLDTRWTPFIGLHVFKWEPLSEHLDPGDDGNMKLVPGVLQYRLPLRPGRYAVSFDPPCGVQREVEILDGEETIVTFEDWKPLHPLHLRITTADGEPAVVDWGLDDHITLAPGEFALLLSGDRNEEVKASVYVETRHNGAHQFPIPKPIPVPWEIRLPRVIPTEIVIENYLASPLRQGVSRVQIENAGSPVSRVLFMDHFAKATAMLPQDVTDVAWFGTRSPLKDAGTNAAGVRTLTTRLPETVHLKLLLGEEALTQLAHRDDEFFALPLTHGSRLSGAHDGERVHFIALPGEYYVGWGSTGGMYLELTHDAEVVFEPRPVGALFVGEVTERRGLGSDGLRYGDLILSVNGIDVSSTDELTRFIREYRDEQPVPLEVYRRGQQIRCLAKNVRFLQLEARLVAAPTMKESDQ